ncbi:hypothetical protein C5G87_21455 [Paenibacillus peoriae]|nr:hypothetical protein C5G87_21455 [Paenibacillus peoriae]
MFTSKDGQVQLTLDNAWTEDQDTNNQSVLGLSERKNEKYAIVNAVSKSDMADNTTLENLKPLSLLISNFL